MLISVGAYIRGDLYPRGPTSEGAYIRRSVYPRGLISEETYIRGGLYPWGLISEGAYNRNKPVSKRAIAVLIGKDFSFTGFKLIFK